MIKSIRLEGELRGYQAATEGVEDVLPEHFEDEDEFLDSFMMISLEYEEGTRELEGYNPAVGEDDEEREDEIWESYQVGVRLGIKKRFQEIMGMFDE